MALLVAHTTFLEISCHGSIIIIELIQVLGSLYLYNIYIYPKLPLTAVIYPDSTPRSAASRLGLRCTSLSAVCDISWTLYIYRYLSVSKKNSIVLLV